jgi:hypothetical protein
MRTCLDMPTLRPIRAMLNCTEVNGRHRNGWTGYTKVYGLRPANGRSSSSRHILTALQETL